MGILIKLSMEGKFSITVFESPSDMIHIMGMIIRILSKIKCSSTRFVPTFCDTKMAYGDINHGDIK